MDPIDLLNEEVISLAQAARDFPGGGVHLSTTWRHALKGVAGVKLETVRLGGKRVTSRQAVERFLARLNANDRPNSITSRQRSREIELAEDELSSDGV